MAKVTMAEIGWLLVLLGAVPQVYSQVPSDAPAESRNQAEGAPTDEDISHRVHDKLIADSESYYTHVTVRVDHGVVTLGGLVFSPEALGRAKHIAADVRGVTKVVNQMSLEREDSR